MTKKDFVERFARKMGMPVYQAGNYVDGVLNTIIESLAEGETVALPTFGAFEVRVRSARNGRNPRTGDAVQVPETRYPAFRPGSKMKEACL